VLGREPPRGTPPGSPTALHTAEQGRISDAERLQS